MRVAEQQGSSARAPQDRRDISPLQGRPRPTIHVFDTRFKSSLSILHDTCEYLHPNLDPFETCTIHDNTWPILGFFLWSVSVVFCVYLEGLFDTHRYLTLIGYFKIPPNTTKYFWGNTDPTFGGNLTQARRRPYARRPDRVYMYCVSPEGRRSGHSVSELQLQPRRRGGGNFEPLFLVYVGGVVS